MAVKSSDQITIVDLTDAYSVTLTSESASFAADKDGKALNATTFTTQVVALRGTEAVTPSITAADIVKSENLTVTVSTSSPYSVINPGISISIAKGKALANNVGEVDIPVVLENGITLHKKFSISAARTGAAGSSMYTYVRYSENANGSGMTTAPTATTKYIGIYVGTSSSVPAYTAFTWSKYVGDPGSSSYTFVRYSANEDGTDFVSEPTADTKYVGIAVTTTSSAPTAKTAYTWSKYVGDDAINMVVTSSNGVIFKNSAIETTLTAHVYRAGVELTASQIAELGTIKWYKDGGTTAVATGATLSITAGSVTNKADYEARLEE